jgi:hypothetical protein
VRMAELCNNIWQLPRSCAGTVHEYRITGQDVVPGKPGIGLITTLCDRHRDHLQNLNADWSVVMADGAIAHAFGEDIQ